MRLGNANLVSMPTPLRSLTLAGLTAAAVATAAPAPAAGASEKVALLVTGQTVLAPQQLEQLSRDHYAAMQTALEQDGWRVRIVVAPGGDLRADGALIGDAVRAESSATDIALIAHSAGTLSARHYLKAFGGDERVGTYVSMGAPQYGSPGGCVQPPGGGWDTCPLAPFVTELNRGDDTPGATTYVGIADDMADGRLDGGQCRVTPIPGVVHTTMTADPRVIDAVRHAVAGRCDGTFVTEADGSIHVLDTLFPTLR